jgi:hypothetical protein
VPKPEPKPYYYSIRASGDPLKAPEFHVAYNPFCAASNHDEPIIVDYLNIGFPSTFDSSTPPDTVEKSDTTTLLEGHRTREAGGVATDDTWSFKGSQ